MKTTAKITSKGQVTIPQFIREALGLLPNTEAKFVLEQGSARLMKVKQPSTRSKAAISALRGSATVKMSTDQIMALTRNRRR